MQHRMYHNLITMIGNLIYTLASVALLLMSLTMIGYAVSQVWQALAAGQQIIDKLLDGISLIVIAIAGFDVSKYLVEEEVLRERELRSPHEARQTLTKFMVIIVIAVSLEALVFIFGSGKEDVTTLIYPALLLGLVTLLLIGLGLYQRLSVDVEQDKNKAHQV